MYKSVQKFCIALCLLEKLFSKVERNFCSKTLFLIKTFCEGYFNVKFKM